jgi:hypothetical protein
LSRGLEQGSCEGGESNGTLSEVFDLERRGQATRIFGEVESI